MLDNKQIETPLLVQAGGSGVLDLVQEVPADSGFGLNLIQEIKMVLVLVN
ncbi:hypothetical protein GH714_001799, partial [Hevea brasiliensis]